MDNLEIIFQSLGFLVSSLTLVLAWLIFRHFQKQQISIKQIDEVANLIKYVSNQKLEISFGISTGNLFGGTLYKLSIFEIPLLGFDDSDFDDKHVLLKAGSNSFLNFEKYQYNPLIPVSIKEELINFQSKMGDAIFIDDLKKEFEVSGDILNVIVNGDSSSSQKPTIFGTLSGKQHSYIYYNAFACASWANFKACAISLSDSINSWLDKYNLNELKV